MIAASHRTDKGDYRTMNEDSCLVKMGQVGPYVTGLFVLADGVGGLDAGEEASRITTDTLAEWWDKSYSIDEEVYGAPVKPLADTITGIDARIRNYAEKNGLKIGTTLSVLFIWKNHVFIFHVGDTKIVGSDVTGLRQLTEDHVQADASGKKLLTRVYGNARAERSELFMNRIEPAHKTRFFLISDGVSSVLGPEILSANKDAYLPDACNNIIDEAFRHGGKDNASVIIVDYAPDPD